MFINFTLRSTYVSSLSSIGSNISVIRSLSSSLLSSLIAVSLGLLVRASRLSSSSRSILSPSLSSTSSGSSSLSSSSLSSSSRSYSSTVLKLEGKLLRESNNSLYAGGYPKLAIAPIRILSR